MPHMSGPFKEGDLAVRFFPQGTGLVQGWVCLQKVPSPPLWGKDPSVRSALLSLCREGYDGTRFLRGSFSYTIINIRDVGR